MSFSDQIKTFINDTKLKMDLITQDIVISIGTQVITFSPVLTGRFVGNWQLTVGAPSNQSLINYDPDKVDTINELKRKAGTLTAGEVAYICNNLNYSLEIEINGWRLTQAYAPVRRTEQMFIDIVKEVVERRSK